MSRELYSEREEWSDVTPIAQYEDVTPLAPIFYADEYRDATDYFRGIVRAGQMSPRVLELTEHIINLNPAHYSAWQYRYKTLISLKSPLDDELKLMDEIALRFPKTYQVWHHRRLLLTALRSSSPTSSVDNAKSELGFIARCLDDDAKNYHTWSYRQWLLAHFNEDALWAGEMEWVEGMLRDDIRNNSAWHHRFFLVFQSGARTGDEDREAVLQRELRYVKDAIGLAPNNASAWNYLRGVLDHTNTSYDCVRIFVEPYTVARSSADYDEVIDLDDPRPQAGAQLPCPAAIEFLADTLEQEGGEDNVKRAAAHYKSLGDEYDTIRKKYWEYRIKEVLAAA